MATNRSTGWDNQDLKDLTPSEKLEEALAVQHNLIVRMGTVSSTSADGVAISRQLSLLESYIKALQTQINAETCGVLQFNQVNEVVG